MTLEGISNAAVGQRLKISTRTVEGHLLRVRRVLGLQRIVSPTLRPRTVQASPSPIKAAMATRPELLSPPFVMRDVVRGPLVAASEGARATIAAALQTWARKGSV